MPGLGQGPSAPLTGVAGRPGSGYARSRCPPSSALSERMKDRRGAGPAAIPASRGPGTAQMGAIALDDGCHLASISTMCRCGSISTVGATTSPPSPAIAGCRRVSMPWLSVRRRSQRQLVWLAVCLPRVSASRPCLGLYRWLVPPSHGRGTPDREVSPLPRQTWSLPGPAPRAGGISFRPVISKG